MDVYLQGMIDQAAQIGASGRWNALNRRLEVLFAKPDFQGDWWAQLTGSLCTMCFTEYLALKHEYESPSRDAGAVLAWRARNLLELSVWATFCMKDAANARRLYEDAGRDANEIYNAMIKWGTATKQGDAWAESLIDAKNELSSRALALDKIQSFDGSFKDVNDAAKQCGLGEHYRVFSKMLAKFVHPTAMRILSPPDLEREATQRNWFYGYGCLFFTGAFHALEVSTATFLDGDSAFSGQVS